MPRGTSTISIPPLWLEFIRLMELLPGDINCAWHHSGGFCALSLISARPPDKAPGKITNKPQITASVASLRDRSVGMSCFFFSLFHSSFFCFCFFGGGGGIPNLSGQVIRKIPPTHPAHGWVHPYSPTDSPWQCCSPHQTDPLAVTHAWHHPLKSQGPNSQQRGNPPTSP